MFRQSANKLKKVELAGTGVCPLGANLLSHIKSSSIGINITQSQDLRESRFLIINRAIVTSVAIAHDYFGVGTRQCRVQSCSQSTRRQNVGNTMQILYLSVAGVLTKCQQSYIIVSPIK